MAHTISRHLVRWGAAIVLLAMAAPCLAAKPLKDKDRQQLVNVVKQHYDETMMQGAEVIRIGGKNILVSVVGVKKGANSQRVAQVKAARTAGEYLQAASNKSVTVHEVTDNNSYSLKDKALDSGRTHNSVASSNIEQQTEDITTIETSEKFTDRILQTSFTEVNHIEPLCRLGISDGEIIYAYYLILK